MEGKCFIFLLEIGKSMKVVRFKGYRVINIYLLRFSAKISEIRWICKNIISIFNAPLDCPLKSDEKDK
jgi:hypothetical protein